MIAMLTCIIQHNWSLDTVDILTLEIKKTWYKCRTLVVVEVQCIKRLSTCITMQSYNSNVIQTSGNYVALQIYVLLLYKCSINILSTCNRVHF